MPDKKHKLSGGADNTHVSDAQFPGKNIHKSTFIPGHARLSSPDAVCVRSVQKHSLS